MHEFAIHDQVVVPELGLGKIIGELTYDGVPYFRILCNDVTVTRPKSDMTSSGVRELCSYEDIQAVFKILQGKRPHIKAANNNQRYKKYREDLNGGDIITLARLVRHLYTKDAGELASQRLEIYEKALQRLTDEIVQVLDVLSQGARGTIESIIDHEPLPSEWAEKLKTP